MIATLSFLRKKLSGSVLYCALFTILFCGDALAQDPTIGSIAPTRATTRSLVTITGTNFTGLATTGAVKIGTTNQTYTVVNSTTITFTPTTSGTVTVTKGSVIATGPNVTVVTATAAPSTIPVTGAITDFNGYWNSSTTVQPDNRHNLVGFTYGTSPAVTYSTGVNNGILTSNGISYTPGNFRGFPLGNLPGSIASNGSVYLAFGRLIDGNATTAVQTSPAVAGKTIRDALTDGIKGLDLGTGVTNVSTSLFFDFSVQNINVAKINDAEPDILISQIADAASGKDFYAFTDASGNIVGNILEANIGSNTLGNYRLDLFSLQTSTAHNTATVNGTIDPGDPATRPIRMIAFKLSDFGITAANAGSIAKFKVLPAGFSDPAFFAFNESAMSVSPPVITVQPTSKVVCTGTTSTTTFNVTATGEGLTYQWKKNGVDIAGATSASYTITNATTADVAAYTVTVTNIGGSVTSTPAYLNAIFDVQPLSAAVCLNTPTTLIAHANGLNVTYQWYSNTVNSTTGGTLIAGATGATRTVSTANPGTIYYYVVATANAQTCTATTSAVAEVTVATTNNWIGAASSDWNTPANWSCNLVPTVEIIANIPVVETTFYPILSSGSGTCKDLNVATGASVTISGTGVLNIAGAINSTGTINTADGTLAFIGTTGAQNIPANVLQTGKIKSLTVNNTAGLTLNSALDLTGILTLTSGTLTTGNHLTLKSNVLTTAMIAPVTGNVIGNMTIERYIPSKRAFRFLSSPVDGGTIHENWQENGTDIANFGTDITGAGGAANGFDVSGSNNPSLFTYLNNNQGTGSSWLAATSTNVTLSAGVGYRMLVRGDRTVNQNVNAAPSTITTLRTTGTIKIGNVSRNDLNPHANGYNLIGNPYQAPVSMTSVLAASSHLSPNFYYVWDPTINTRGAYVTVDLTDNTNSTQGSVADQYLQPGQSAFVITSSAIPAGQTPSLTFREDYKHLSTQTTTIFKSAANAAKIRFTLYDSNVLASNGPAADGFIINFNENNSNDLDVNDAEKLVNQDETAGLMNAGKVLSYESRSLPVVSEIIPISNTQYRGTDYTYKASVSGLSNVTAYLFDKYTGTRTELANDVETSVPFQVNSAVAASVAANRFDIVFETTALGSNSNALDKNVKIYPNPATENNFFIKLPTQTQGDVAVKLVNMLGQEVYSSRLTAQNDIVKVQPNTTLTQGIYMVQIAIGKNTTTQKLIIK